jgi:hypothetical protein
MGRQIYAFYPNFVQTMAKLFLVLAILACILPAIAQNPSGVKPGVTQSNAAKAGPAQPGAAKPDLTQPGAAKPTPTAPPTIADTAIRFADSIFAGSGFLYEQVESGIPPDIQPILIRFNNALVANRQWFEQYKNAYAGQPLPYNQRFGISADEYRRLQTLTPQLVPVDTQKVTIIREAGYIRFHGVDSSFQLLDYLQVGLKTQLLIYGGDTIPLVGRTATAPRSPYGQWQGFTWRLEKADAASALATSRLTARVVEINMGLTVPEPQGPSSPAAGQASPAAPQQRIFLRVKYQQMQDGVTTANLEMVGYVMH